ncbi:MAG: DUF4350 domain-containing protein [Gemmatimonadota bacterium]|nr:DUF4350 domain-containing protein [Gemmatimonadota bacterium]
MAFALSLAVAHPSVAQRPDISGTWELTASPSPPSFERSRSRVPRQCDPDEAQIGMLRLYAGPAKRLTIRQSEQTLLMGTETGSPFTFYPDGRVAKLPGALEVVYRARWTTDGALVIEWKQFGGTMVESYVLSAGQPLLRVDQTIDHPALSQPARQRLSYRRVAEPLEQSVPASRQAPPTSGQVADSTFRPVIERPAYVTGTGPVVLVDEAHANAHTASGRYLPLAELLRRDGYIVKSSGERFTAESLRAGKVLVIANAQKPFTRDEVTAVHDWVAAGGSLLLITDHPPFVEAAMDLGRAFGIRFRNSGAADLTTGGLVTFRRSNATLKDHPVTRGIDEVVTFAGSSFQIDTKGQPLLVFGPQVCADRLGPNPVALEGHLQGAVLPFGAGRVAVFGEAAMFSAQVAGPNRTPMGMNAPIAKQNVQFLLNLMHWLTGLM